MYIEPRTNIRLLTGVPLDESFEHTINFTNKQVQADYFASKTKYLMTDSTYQRVNRGRARVPYPAEGLYNCNYMMFQNSAYGTKWFYAFITGVEYVNDATTEITFEIDPIQSYCFDWHLKQCMVERQHVTNDAIGANLMAEDVDIGDYVCSDYQETTAYHRMVLIVASGSDDEGHPVQGGVLSGMYCGVDYHPFYIQKEDGTWDDNAVAMANSYITALVNQGKGDDIISVFMMPLAFAQNLATDWKEEPVKQTHLFVMDNPYQLDGYVPKNNKLYTFPYNALKVDTGENSKIYKFEFFRNIYDSDYDDSYQFEVWSQLTCAPSMLLIPHRYKGVLNNFGEAMSCDGYGQCAFTIDGYRAWLAQNSIKNNANLAQNLAMMTVAVGTGNPILGATQVLGATQTISNIAQASMLPHKVSGTQANNVLLAHNKLGFFFSRMTVNAKYARMIDDYFTKFGYAINELRVPDIDARPHWTYVKTRKCVMECDAPADDVKKICSIFDNGITFWKHPEEVGNYSLDNSPA